MAAATEASREEGKGAAGELDGRLRAALLGRAPGWVIWCTRCRPTLGEVRGVHQLPQPYATCEQ